MVLDPDPLPWSRGDEEPYFLLIARRCLFNLWGEGEGNNRWSRNRMSAKAKATDPCTLSRIHEAFSKWQWPTLENGFDAHITKGREPSLAR